MCDEEEITCGKPKWYVGCIFMGVVLVALVYKLIIWLSTQTS